MTILTRLRNWLRPYPDDAEMQREMLARVAAERHLLRDVSQVQREADHIARLWGRNVVQYTQWIRPDSKFMGGTK